MKVPFFVYIDNDVLKFKHCQSCPPLYRDYIFHYIITKILLQNSKRILTHTTLI